MEQIKNGMLELMNQITFSQLTGGSKTTAASNGDSEFGKLLEKKNEEVKSETAPAKKEAEDGVQQTDKPSESKKKPEPGKDEETCDVAREAACAQMVWLVPETHVEEQPVVQEMGVEVVSGEVVEMTGAAEEIVAAQETADPVQPQKVLSQETEQTVETDLPAQQTVEAPEETVQTDVVKDEAQQLAERPEAEVKVKVESDEAGSEAAVVEAPLFKDVETAPIKVADAPAETEDVNVTKQVEEKLASALDSGETKVEIQLTPESLGKVTVELTRSADGTLSILLNAESEQTRELLAKHANTLQEAIVDRGQQNVQIEVSRGEDTQRQNDAQQDLQDGRNNDQSEQQRRHQESDSEDFLQQLRLGLVDVQEET